MARVFIYPEFLIGNPDINAFLQAMNSRSHESIEARLDDLASGENTVEAVREGLKKWYVGYNHASIGDCGKITMNVEHVGFATAKALQDDQLFDGQESSSRYIPFDQQPDPLVDVATLSKHRQAIAQYVRARDVVHAAITKQHPELKPAGVNVKTFDIVRGLLPITGQTQTSWTISIRKAQEKLVHMEHHPYHYVREDALVIRNTLANKWPDLFGDDLFVKANKEYLDGEPFEWFLPDEYYYGDADNHILAIYPGDSKWKHWTSNSVVNERHYGDETFIGEIDYGGYRDVQRHRGAYIKSTDPYHSADLGLGVSQWYVDQLHQYGGFEFEHFDGLPLLMENVVTSVTSSIPQMRYMLDLRTKPSVHATVRDFFGDMHENILQHYPKMQNAFTVHFDDDTDYNRRAKQTIEKRDQVAS